MINVLLAFSDTGGGHRAAACALREAVALQAPTAQLSMVDPYALSARWPFNRLAAGYPQVVNKATWLWRNGFRLTNNSALTATLQSLAWPVLRSTFHGLRQTPSPDVVVTTHPLLTAPLRRAFPNTPLMVVVTDLETGHVSWYDRRADVMVVPTATARARAIANGVAPAVTELLGLPVSPSLLSAHEPLGSLREQLGWRTDRPTVLLVGGGDGVGPLETLTAAIDQADLGCDVAVVTGRNAALAERLRATDWRGRVHVYGYVNNLGALMRAAAILVTKAGPGTISEACVAGCPMVLYGAIPGQETGNIRFVAQGGAGVWAPSTREVVKALHAWLTSPAAYDRRAAAAAAARRLARPNAAQQIATRILELAAGTAGSRPFDALLRRAPLTPRDQTRHCDLGPINPSSAPRRRPREDSRQTYTSRLPPTTTTSGRRASRGSPA
jgi:1,2-diacylglycerol 3-beta-galactosyltransferase